MNIMNNVQVVLRDEELYLPKYETDGSAGFDLRSTVDAEIKPGESLAIDTGISVWMGSLYNNDKPDGEFAFAGLVLPRSGLGTKQGLVLANLVGLIDEDYQGPMICHMWNRNEQETKKSVFIRRGDRIAQFVMVPVLRPSFQVVKEFSETTTRGVGGFGSTGSK